MLRPLFQLILLAMLALPLAQGQMVKNPARKGEFPGLSLLPAGSTVRGISLPRYENHRVSAHIMADLLEIISAGRAKLTGIHSSLYSEEGEETILKLEYAHYNFETEMMTSDKEVSIQNPRFRARGESISYSTARQQGLVRGPVHTLFHTATMVKSPEKKPAP